MITALLILVYLVCTVVTYGAALADFEADDNDEDTFRGNCATALGASLIPVVGWIGVLFGTALYQHGLQFTNKRV